jgi:hypothetical protein
VAPSMSAATVRAAATMSVSGRSVGRVMVSMGAERSVTMRPFRASTERAIVA